MKLILLILVLIVHLQLVLNASDSCDDATYLQLHSQGEATRNCNPTDTAAIDAGECNFAGACTSCVPGVDQPIPFSAAETGFPNGLLNCAGDNVCQIQDPAAKALYSFKNSNDYLSCAGTQACAPWRVSNVAAVCCSDGTLNCQGANFNLVAGNPLCSNDICCKGNNVCQGVIAEGVSSLSCRGGSCNQARVTMTQDLYCEGDLTAPSCSERSTFTFTGGNGKCATCLGNGNYTCGATETQFALVDEASVCMRCETGACLNATVLMLDNTALDLQCDADSCSGMQISTGPTFSVSCTCSGAGCSNVGGSVTCTQVSENAQPCGSRCSSGIPTFCDKGPNANPECSACNPNAGTCGNPIDNAAINAGQCNFDGACTSCVPNVDEPIPFAGAEFPDGLLNCSGDNVCQIQDPAAKALYSFKNSNDYLSCAGTQACAPWRVSNVAAVCCSDGTLNCQGANFNLVAGNPLCSNDICCKGNNVCQGVIAEGVSSLSCRGGSCNQARVTMTQDLYCEGDLTAPSCSERSTFTFTGGNGKCATCLGNGNYTCGATETQFALVDEASVCMKCETGACLNATVLMLDNTALDLQCDADSCSGMQISTGPTFSVSCTCSGAGCSNVGGSVTCTQVSENAQPCGSRCSSGVPTLCDRGPNANPDCSACKTGGGTCGNPIDNAAINRGQCNFDGACTSCVPNVDEPIPFIPVEFPDGLLNCSGDNVCQIQDPAAKALYSFKNSNDYLSCAGTQACAPWRVSNVAAVCCSDGTLNCQGANFNLVAGNPLCSNDICCKGNNVCQGVIAEGVSSLSCRGGSCNQARVTMTQDLYCEGDLTAPSCSERSTFTFTGGNGKCATCLGNGNYTCGATETQFALVDEASVCMRCETGACLNATVLMLDNTALDLQCDADSCSGMQISTGPTFSVSCTCSGAGCSNVGGSVTCTQVSENAQPCGSRCSSGVPTFCDKGPNANPDCSACKTGGGGVVGDPHITTLDGKHYTLLQQGHFLLWSFADFQLFAHYSGKASFTKGLLLIDKSGSSPQALELTSKDCQWRSQGVSFSELTTLDLRNADGSVFAAFKVWKETVKEHKSIKRQHVKILLKSKNKMRELAHLAVTCKAVHFLSVQLKMAEVEDARYVKGQLGPKRTHFHAAKKAMLLEMDSEYVVTW